MGWVLMRVLSCAESDDGQIPLLYISSLIALHAKFLIFYLPLDWPKQKPVQHATRDYGFASLILKIEINGVATLSRSVDSSNRYCLHLGSEGAMKVAEPAHGRKEA